MDNEPITDLARPDRAIELDVAALARAWDVSVSDSCKTTSNLARKVATPDEKLLETCNSFFSNARLANFIWLLIMGLKKVHRLAIADRL